MKNTILIILTALLWMACSDEDKVNIKPVAAFKASEVIVQEGQSVAFTDLSFDQDGQIAQWAWDFGNGSSSEEQSPIAEYSAAGEYTVTLSVWDNQGTQNANVFSKTITVKEKSTADVEPEIAWEFQTPCGFQDVSPAIDDHGNVVVGCDANNARGGQNIWVINNGTEVWHYSSGDVIRSSAAIADDGTIYVGSYDKKLYAFSASSSAPLGTFDLGATAKFSSPAIDKDGTVFFSANKKLFAINAAPGMTEKWNADCEGTTQSTPVIGDDAVYICSNSGKLYAFAKNDGKKRWTVEYGKTCTSVPAIGEDGTIYLCGETADGGIVMAVNPDGTVKWQQYSASAFANSGISLSIDGYLYVGNSDGDMLCYTQEDGTSVWKFKAQGQIRSVPAIDNAGNIYFGDGKGYFYVLNSKGKLSYKEIQLGANIWSSPVIDKNGLIYVCTDVTKSSEPGKVFALRTHATGAQQGWSMRSGDYKRNARKK